MRGKQLVAAVSGVKNAGKTTLMEKLIRELTARGLRVAAIKHDGHDFAPDVPGTDSHRFGRAGALGYAVFSPRRYQLVKAEPVSAEQLIAAFPEADMILLEGFKDSPYPKIEVVRAAVSRDPVCDPATLLAIAADLPLAIGGVPVLGLDDVAALADLLLRAGGG